MSFFKGNYYTHKDASKKLGVHWQTLRNWEKQGKIKTIRSPVVKDIMILIIL